MALRNCCRAAGLKLRSRTRKVSMANCKSSRHCAGVNRCRPDSVAEEASLACPAATTQQSKRSNERKRTGISLIRVSLFFASTGGKQESDHRGMSTLPGHAQRRPPLPFRVTHNDPYSGVHIRAAGDQKFHHGQVSATTCLNQSVLVIWNHLVDAGSPIQ